MEKSAQGWTYNFPCIKSFITPNPRRSLGKSLWYKKQLLWTLCNRPFPWGVFQKANQNFHHVSQSPLEQSSSWITALPSISCCSSPCLQPLLPLPLPILHWDCDSCHFCSLFLHISLDFLSCLLNFVRRFQIHLIWKTEVLEGFDILGLLRVELLWLFNLVLFGWIFVFFEVFLGEGSWVGFCCSY